MHMASLVVNAKPLEVLGVAASSGSRDVSMSRRERVRSMTSSLVKLAGHVSPIRDSKSVGKKG